MSWTDRLQRARLEMLDRRSDVDDFANRLFSGTTYSLWKAARPLTARYSTGLVLDAGSGRGAWAGVICENAQRESVDIAAKGAEHPTWAADIMDMPIVPSGRYDTVICHQVLEHVPRPCDAIAELYRVLKPGGHLVLSVPHLSRQHELPHDYMRFTPQGLEYILRDVGFEIISLSTYGGLLSFIHHQLATALLGIASLARPLVLPFGLLNSPISWLCAKTDAVLDKHGSLAVGVLVVAKKARITGSD